MIGFFFPHLFMFFGLAADAPVIVSSEPSSVDQRALEQLASTYFTNGDYARTSEIYQQLHDSGNGTGIIYFNQGNAHFLAGQLPEAILAYRRADRYMTRDARLQANLTDARRRVVDAPTATNFDWTVGFNWIPLQLRLILASLIYLIAMPMLFLPWGCRNHCVNLYWLDFSYQIARHDRIPPPYEGTPIALRAKGIMTAISLFLLSVSVIMAGGSYLTERHPLAVVHKDTILRTGNGNTYPPHEINGVAVKLHAGVEARVRTERPNGWVQLELAGGRVGWLPRKALLIDE